MEPTRYWTTDPLEPVKIRMGTEGIAAEEPLSIPQCFIQTAEEFPDHPALVYEDPSTHHWETVTYREYLHQVHHMARVLIHLGLQPGHSVGIMAFNCPQWMVSNMGAIFAGGLGAGIYTTNSAEVTCHILRQSRANVVVVEDERQMEKVLSVRQELPLLRAVVQLQGELKEGLRQEEGYYTWRDLQGMNVNHVETEYQERLLGITPNQSAILIFTSGTIGMPKGVLLSHDTLMWNCKQIARAFEGYEKGKEVLVSFLPLSHIGGQLSDVFLAIYSAGTVYFADKNALKGTLLKTIQKARPTRLMAVPRIYEKMQAGLIQQTSQLSLFRRHLLNWAKYYSLQHYQDIAEGRPSKTWQYLLAKNTILKKVKQTLGLDRCLSVAAGAAPVTVELKTFFMSFDIQLIECFGMSETGGPASLGDPHHFRMESAGKILPGTQVKISNPDEGGHGEVLLRGRHVFMGYIGEEQKTLETLDEDGWLHTGDLGYVDQEGFLYITGRLKELIITAGGENVPPVHVETLVKDQLPCVSNALLVGDHRKYLTLLLTLKTEMDAETGAPRNALAGETKEWLLREAGVEYETLGHVLEKGPCPRVLKALQEGIDRANQRAISNAQKVQKFRLLPQDFSVPTGELGPTLKLKRSVVLKKYAEIIDEMYK